MREGESNRMASQKDKAEERDMLKEQVQRLEVTCAELESLPSSRSVYLKHGALFFRSDVKSAAKLQQKMLEKVKAGLK